MTCKDIDFFSRGVYGTILALGEKWDLTISGLAKYSDVSVDKIRRAFSVLERAGVLRRSRIQGERGRFVGWKYEVLCSPLSDRSESCGNSTDIGKTPTSVKHRHRENTDIGKTPTSGKHRHRENPDIGKTPTSGNTDVRKHRRSETPTFGKSNTIKDYNISKDLTEYNIPPISPQGDDVGKEKDFVHPTPNENARGATPPTPQEIAYYVRGRGFADPEGFADYYVEINNNRGWRMKSGKPIVNWKNNIVSSWEEHHKNRTFPKPDTAPSVTATPISEEQLLKILRT